MDICSSNIIPPSIGLCIKSSAAKKYAHHSFGLIKNYHLRSEVLTISMLILDQQILFACSRDRRLSGKTT